jgi:hypothetical protein
VQVSVLADPPAWSQAGPGTTTTPYVTGVLVIDGETSQDIDDIVGAFIRNDEGEYEMPRRGAGEYVDYLDDAYQFSLPCIATWKAATACSSRVG